MEGYAHINTCHRSIVGKLNINHKTYNIYEGINTVGRNREATVNIKHLNISQHHALIVVINGTHYISDLKSSNGTYCENKKIVPLSLHPLKHNNKIKLGDVSGVYITQDLNGNQSQSILNQTQDVTQSFYGLNTQILQISQGNVLPEVEDIHEMATQVMPFNNFKVPRSVKSFEEDIHDMATQEIKGPDRDYVSPDDIATQVISRQIYPEATTSNENKTFSNSNGISNSHSKEVIEEQLKCPDEAATQVVDYDITADDIATQVVPRKIHLEPTTSNGTKTYDNLNEVSDALSKKDHSSHKVVKEQPECTDDVATQIVDYDDATNSVLQNVDPINGEEDLTDCEENIAVMLETRKKETNETVEQNSNDSTDVFNVDSNMDIMNKLGDSVQADQTIQKSRINQDDKKNSLKILEKNNAFTEEPKNIEKISVNNTTEIDDNEEDDETDCEDNLVINQENEKTKQITNTEEGSSDSTDFFKISDHSNIGPKKMNASNNVQFVKKSVLSSDSESEEKLYFSRRKSARVIETQDLEASLISHNKNDMDDKKESDSVVNTTNITTKPLSLKAATAEQNESVPEEANIETLDMSPKSSDHIHFKKKVCQLSSDSESEEEIQTSRKKKSPMVISTQDFPCTMKNLKGTKRHLFQEQDIHCIQDTDSDSELDLAVDKTLEKSIPATQNITTEFNDSDFIPATQEIATTSKKKTNSQFSSEESFRLGLTQMMEETMPTLENVKETTSATYIGDTVIENPTQKIPVDDTLLFDAPTQKINNTTVVGDDHNADIYLACTQKISCKQTEPPEHSDIYFAATQDLRPIHEKSKNTQLGMSDTYLAVTQDCTSKPNNGNGPNIQTNVLENDTSSIFDAATQQISETDKAGNTNVEKSQLDMSDIYIEATQKIVPLNIKNKQVKPLDISDIYLASTQKITSTQSNESDIYNVATQQIFNTQDMFDESTQVISNNFKETDDDVFLKPTQIVPVASSSNVPKKFLFKKVNCSLDGSLSSILSNDAEEVFSKNSVDFTEFKDQEGDSRPTNPILQVLESVNEGHISNAEIKEGDNSGLISENVNIETAGNEHVDVIPEKVDNIETRIKRGNDKEKSKIIPKQITELKTRSRKRQLSVGPNEEVQSDVHTNITDKNKRQSSRNKIRRNDPELSTEKIVQDNPVIDIKVEPNHEENLNDNKIDLIVKQETDDFKIENSPQKPLIEIKNRVKKRRSSTDNASMDVSRDTKLKLGQTKVEAAPPSRPGRSTRRKLLSTEQLNDISTINIQPNPDDSNTTCSTSRIEVNQSIALLESRAMKTKKSAKNVEKTEKLDLKVPKNRRSMTAVEQNDPVSADSSRKTTVENKRRGRSKVVKEPISEAPSTSSRRKVVKKEEVDEVKIESDPRVQKRPGKRTFSKNTTSDSGESSVSTPKKQKIQVGESILNSAERAGRRQKPKVVFTMMDSPQMESMIKQLGGSVVDSIEACTVLVTQQVKRSQKLLCAVGQAKPICSPQWIVESKKSHEFLDPWDYILKDPEAEDEWNFDLEVSLKRSREHRLLDNYQFNIQVTKAIDVLKGAIEACGGKSISKIPAKPLKNTFVISSQENQTKYKRILKQHSDVKVIEAEAIFDAVLRQELRFSNHYLT